MIEANWLKASEIMPPHNVSVLVFIPEEDNHVTTGMWDISEKWVLLDDYRVPISEVTYWSDMVDTPEDKEYVPSNRSLEEESQSGTIRILQKKLFDLEHQLSDIIETAAENGGVVYFTQSYVEKLKTLIKG